MRGVTLDDYLIGGPIAALDVITDITGASQIDIVALCLGGALRASDLIFSYVTSNWVMGGQPPAFDLLAWNSDSTRRPAAMHSFYLRTLYIDNQLARGEMELGGQHLSLQDVKSDAYVVGAVNDHIVPWQASYKATHLLGGNVRYVLSNGGHVAGIVNPPGPKARHEAAGKNRPTAAEWRLGGEPQRFMVGGLDRMGREAGRQADGAATHGQPPPQGTR